LIIDQHAAQERIKYEDFLKRFHNGIVKQKLIRAKVMELSPVEFNLIINNLELLSKVGFEIEEYGKNSVIIRTIPYIFERFYDELLSDLISELKK